MSLIVVWTFAILGAVTVAAGALELWERLRRGHREPDNGSVSTGWLEEHGRGRRDSGK